ncbi:MAG: FAD-dependent oxidoreductase [Hyphomicrobiales bacterium]|nr:FAD-dependent oxidoreductase [Hyphomicrobiales bacterium]
MSDHEKWVVVGGGMMGLTAALHLAKAGRSVTIVESDPKLGGLAASCSLGNIHWDRFYHVILSSDDHLRGLLASLGLDEEIRFHRTKTGLHIDGRLQSISTPAELLACRDIPWTAKFGLGRAILASMRETSIDDLDAQTALDWLNRHSGKKAVDTIWRPLLRSKLGTSMDEASALFIWSTLRRLYGVGAGRFGSGQFGYVDGGYRRILSALEDKLVQLGVTILHNWPVADIRSVDRRHTLSSSGQPDIQADRVVLTIPGPHAARACADLTAQESKRMAETDFLGVICLSLLLDRPITDFYVTNLIDEGGAFTGIIEMTNLIEPAIFGGRHLIYLPLYLRSDDPRFTHDDRNITETFTTYLAKLIPGFSSENILAARVNRAAKVFATPHVGRAGNIPEFRTTVPGLYVLNGSQIVGGTMNVNETVRHAEEGMASLFKEVTAVEKPMPAVRLWSQSRPWEDRLAHLENDLLVKGLKQLQLLPGSGDKVLDIGCGPGITAERLKDHVHSYVGLDVSITALARARSRIGAAENVVFLPLDHSSPSKLDVINGQRFTFILCNSVIQYLPDVASIKFLFESMKDVGEPTARIVVGDIPVRSRFIREAMLAWAQGIRAGFPLQALTGLIKRAFSHFFRVIPAERPITHNLAELTKAARDAGFELEVFPVPARPSGNRVSLVCRPAKATT